MEQTADERWVTDEDLSAARRRIAARIPGFQPPAAYGVARVDDDELTFGYVNGAGGIHRLPAVVLASVCGYTNRTGVFPLTAGQFSQAVTGLAPAGAATHWEHPNLWSWRQLVEDAGPASSFLAFFVTDLDDPVVDGRDAAFRARLG